MNFDDASWERLMAAARQAPVERGETAPYGFATRVVALALAAESRRRSFLDYISLRFSLRALGASGLLAAAAVVVSYPTMAKLLSDSVPAVASSTAIAPSPASVDDGSSTAPPESSAESSGSAEDPVAEVVGMVS